MKKFVVALLVAIVTTGGVFAGENPKLVKEIQRKVKVDLSKINLERSKDHFVSVRFKVVNQEIEVLSLRGSKRELTEIMMQELEEMFITTDADPNEVHHFKFRFTKE
jgi:hypothetical protein